MSKAARTSAVLPFYVTASVLGLSSILLLALYPPVAVGDISFRKPLIGAVFTLICILGGSAVVFPKECASMLGSKEKRGSFASHTTYSNNQTIRGHHLDCGRFAPHTIRVKERVLCAACTGLCLGTFVAIAGTAIYFFAGVDFGQFGLLFVAVGAALVALGFAQFKFPGFVRLLLNAFFVVGAFFILVGADAFLQNLLIDFYLLSLVVLWILTRVLLSLWDHSRICRSCTSECEMKKERV